MRTPTPKAPIPTAVQLLDFEAAHPGKHTWAKETRIRETLGVTAARYYQLLARAADSQAGIAHDPITSRRVRGS